MTLAYDYLKTTGSTPMFIFFKKPDGHYSAISLDANKPEDILHALDCAREYIENQIKAINN